MAIPIAKLTILVGAGIVGSILTKEGRLGDVPGFISGAFKIVRKHLQDDNETSSSNKPATDYLLTQVNNLRQQLQHLQASGPVTIVTGSGSGSGTYNITAILLVSVAGYGYAWWKGWRISDMMYVSRRHWTDARDSVAKQVDLVSSSVTTTRRDLSSRIQQVSCSLEDCLEVTTATKEEASELHADISGFHEEVESVQRAVQSLGSKIVQIEGIQDFTTKGVNHLCQLTKKLESRKLENPPQVLRSNSAVPSLEHHQVTHISRVASLPPISVAEPSSPSDVETPRVLQSSRTARAKFFKEVQGLISVVRPESAASCSTEPGASTISNGTSLTSEEPRSSSGGSSTSVRLGWRLPGLNIISRTWSSTDAS